MSGILAAGASATLASVMRGQLMRGKTSHYGAAHIGNSGERARRLRQIERGQLRRENGFYPGIPVTKAEWFAYGIGYQSLSEDARKRLLDAHDRKLLMGDCRREFERGLAEGASPAPASATPAPRKRTRKPKA